MQWRNWLNRGGTAFGISCKQWELPVLTPVKSDIPLPICCVVLGPCASVDIGCHRKKMHPAQTVAFCAHTKRAFQGKLLELETTLRFLTWFSNSEQSPWQKGGKGGVASSISSAHWQICFTQGEAAMTYSAGNIIPAHLQNREWIWTDDRVRDIAATCWCFAAC